MSTYKKYGYFPLGLCPRLRTWKISPRQVDCVVNKTRHRCRRRSSLLTPIRRTVDGSYLFTTSLSIVTVAEFLDKKDSHYFLGSAGFANVETTFATNVGPGPYSLHLSVSAS